MEAKLAVTQGADPLEIDLFLPFLIGRSAAAALKIPHASVSREHCRIYEFDGELAVRDLGSRSGTYVNGQRIDKPTFLSPGDELTVGGITFRATYQIRRQVVLVPHSDPDAGRQPVATSPSGQTGTLDAAATARPRQSVPEQAHHTAGPRQASPPASARSRTEVNARRKAKPAQRQAPPAPGTAAAVVVDSVPQGAAGIPELGMPAVPLVSEVDLEIDEQVPHVAEDELKDFFEGIG